MNKGHLAITNGMIDGIGIYPNWNQTGLYGEIGEKIRNEV